GAAAMFVAMFFLLNKYVPEMRDGIIAEAKAAQSQQQLQARDEKGEIKTLDIYISPERQKITNRDLKELDKNKYFVDEQLGVAVLRPQSSGWLLGSVQSFSKLSLADVPLMELSFGMFRSIAGDAKDKSTFAVRGEKARKVTITKDSEISGIRAGINPFADQAF